ncbi:MAG: hypothetical protein NUV58_04760, partial [Candidatus Roizmanbacteria bacterium]|nr:hypothetical protein [Candidatus Roizmanbacteria bacterium]
NTKFQSKIPVIIKNDNTKKNLFFVQGRFFVLDRGLPMDDPGLSRMYGDYKEIYNATGKLQSRGDLTVIYAFILRK